MPKKTAKKNEIDKITDSEIEKISEIKLVKISRKELLKMMTLNSYLSQYSSKRAIDSVLIKWYQKRDNSNPKKTKEEWEKIIKSFYVETEQ